MPNLKILWDCLYVIYSWLETTTIAWKITVCAPFVYHVCFHYQKSEKKIFQCLCVCLSVNVFVFLRSRTFYIHFVSFFFVARYTSSYTKKLYIIILSRRTCTLRSHAKLFIFCCAYTFNCLFFSFCSISLVFWLFLPASSHTFSLFRNMFDSMVCSFGVIVHIFLYSISLLFLLCASALSWKNIHILYIYYIHANV